MVKEKLSVRDDKIRLLIAAGLYGSGSTRAFNAAARVMRKNGAKDLTIIYSDTLDRQAAEKLDDASLNIIKTHKPDIVLLTFIRWLRPPVIATIRDPRDSVVSMMQRFDLDFGASLDWVATSAFDIVRLIGICDPLVIKYECVASDYSDALRAISRVLRVNATEDELCEIGASLTAESVKREIADLARAGIFRHGKPSEVFDEVTHWHPGHVGDGVIGKYKNILSASEAAQVVYRARDFCNRFEYLSDIPTIKSGESIVFGLAGAGAYYLEHGFSYIESWGVWTVDQRAVMRVPLQHAKGESYEVTINAILSPAFSASDSSARLHILIEGREVIVYRGPVENSTLALTFVVEAGDFLSTDEVEIEFFTVGVTTPGGERDSRLLGLGVRDITIFF